MSMKPLPNFATFPVELIECILDLLDGNEILLSFGHVCRRFQSIARNYNRLSIRFISPLSSNYVQRLRRDIRTENVVALILDNSLGSFDEIKRYLCVTYTRLRSLTLCHIEEDYLQIIINHLKFSDLVSFSLSMSEFTSLKSDSIGLLSTLIALPSLRQLTLDVHSRITDWISWPNGCSVHELKIQQCAYEQFCIILNQLPNLRTFTLNECTMRDVDQSVQPIIHPQLTSLTLNDTELSIGSLEFLLSLFPSLLRLKILKTKACSSNCLQRFCQWEHFINEKLLSLKKFDFYFFGRYYSNESIESILTPFCTSFWLEQKQWFVTAKYSKTGWKPTITFYSSTLSTQKFPDNLDSDGMSYATTTAKNDGLSKISNEWIARFDLFCMTSLTNDALQLPDQNSFLNLTRLALDICAWPLSELLKHPSVSMVFSKLNEIWLLERSPCVLEAEIIENLLQQAPNVQTLGISSNGDFLPKIENICSVVSRRIDHFKLRVRELHCFKLALKFIQHVSTVTFQQYGYAPRLMSDMIKWLRRERRTFIVDLNFKSIQIWIDENNSQIYEVTINHRDVF